LRRLPEEADTGVGGGETGEQARGTVIRSIVDDEEFEVAEVLGPDARDGFR